MLAGDDLTIALFLIGAALTFGAAGMTAAGWRHPVLINGLFGLAGLFFLVGIGWPFLPFLKTMSPVATASIASVATNPVSWFALFVLIIGLLVLGPSSRGRLGAPSNIEASAENNLREEVERLGRQIEVVRLSVPPHVAVPTPEEHAESVANALAEKFVEINRNIFKLRSDHNQLDMRYGWLLDSLFGRDCASRFEEYDNIVCSLGPRLISAAGYNDPNVWVRDYEQWSDSVTGVDAVITVFGVEGHTRFLPVPNNQLEKCADTAPDLIRSKEVQFKTVCLVQRRYEAERSQLELFLRKKSELPPR
ncbi:MAG: hypothetical protein JO328_17480 [Hyphomicrobiales bacterium]|nr:hypothetical protein [Hyphomicrobiales bacterium]MBV9426508.1 hypothetical protein [Bradyrhizobiaceae bacterium]